MRLLQVLVLAVLLCQCERQESAELPTRASSAATRPSSSPVLVGRKTRQRGGASTRTWVYDTTDVGPMHVVVSVPAHDPDERLPVLIALHGRGEALKGPARGARGWVDDYGLDRAIARLAAPPLVVEDFGGMVEEGRLRQLNEALKRRPYKGLIVVCPYTPDLLAGERAFARARPFAEFLVERVLPRVYEQTPALATAATTGIDGVSLGGRAALLVGFEHPEAFGVVAALQAAFDSKEVPRLVELAVRARQHNPKLQLRLLTSDADYFLDVNRDLSRALRESKVPHTLAVVRGDHSYEFNRGPGVYEMLTHHDWALRGQPTL